MNKLFKVLSILLMYPTETTHACLKEAILVVQEACTLSSKNKEKLIVFIQDFQKKPLLETQEFYVEHFDRTPLLSLHLFEHIHGESRSRGQAMVDLVDHYRSWNFEIEAHELPDYLPLFLEFLSCVPEEEAKTLLNDIASVIALLKSRLAARGSFYLPLFDILLELTGKKIPIPVLSEASDQAINALLDNEWEETPVNFMNTSCPSLKERKLP